MFIQVCRASELASLLLLFAPAKLAAQQDPRVSLKDSQKAIRERILTEAGSDTLLYSRVDFNDCAVTVQTRTTRGATGAETRTVYTFHATSLEPRVDAPGSDGVVRLKMASGRPSLRRVEQRIDSGKVKESVSYEPSMEFRFVQPKTAETVQQGFQRLATVCRKANPFRNGGT